MRIVIDHGQTKREIKGTFNLMGNRKDLEDIVTCIQDFLKDEAIAGGWLSVHDIQQSEAGRAPYLGNNPIGRRYDKLS